MDALFWMKFGNELMLHALSEQIIVAASISHKQINHYEQSVSEQNLLSAAFHLCLSLFLKLNLLFDST